MSLKLINPKNPKIVKLHESDMAWDFSSVTKVSVHKVIYPWYKKPFIWLGFKVKTNKTEVIFTKNK